jgi:Tol biopolymer transport system component
VCAALLAALPALTVAAPGVEVNAGLTLPRGASATISPDRLQASGGFFELLSQPAHGTLRLADAPLAPGSRFAQSHINAGQVTYSHDNSDNASDSFDFAVRGIARISLSSQGAQSNANSYCGGFSADGRWFAFFSDASNLVSGDTNGVGDVFVRDLQSGSTTRVSLANDGSQALGGQSECAALSATGRFVAFQSYAWNLVSGDGNGVADVFVRDRDVDGNGVFDELGATSTTRVSVGAGGAEGNEFSLVPSITGDGRFVVFQSGADNLVSGDSNGFQDVFIHDRQAGTTALISRAQGGGWADEASGSGAIAANGRFVAFHSNAGNLIGDDTNGQGDIFVRDLQTNTTERVSVSSQGEQTFTFSADPAISADGRFVTFQSYAGNLSPDDDDTVEDVFIHDRASATTSLVSRASSGLPGNDNSYHATISASGRYVAFVSAASTLVGDDANGLVDAFVRDTVAGTTRRVSLTIDCAEGNGLASEPYISADGLKVAFISSATNLVAGDTNGRDDVFLYEAGVVGTFTISIQDAGSLSISPILDQSVLENSAVGPLPFVLGGDAPESVVLSAESSDPVLIPPGGITFGGSGANRTVSITPAKTDALSVPNRQGQARITLRATRGGESASASFTVTVTPPPWLAMLYLGGDDIEPVRGRGFVSLSGPIRDLLVRLRSMQHNPAMRLVVMADANDSIPIGGFGDSKVFVLEPGGLTNVTGLLTQPASPWPTFPADSELDTGSTATLRSFIDWARRTYPSSPRTFLSLVDHGGGWAPHFGDAAGQPRGATRNQSGGWRGMSIDLTSGGSSLSTRDTGAALSGILGTGRRFDVIFFDACLMGMLESAYEIREAADFLVAGQNQLFADLPYEHYLAADTLLPDTSPEGLAELIVERYNVGADPAQSPFTLASLDLRQLRSGVPNNLAMRVNALADRLLAALPPSPVPLSNPLRAALTEAYNGAQKFDYDSSLTLDEREGYVDLVDFAGRLARSSSPAVSADIKAAASAVEQAVVGTGVAPVVLRHRPVSGSYGGQPWSFDAAHGISIFLPLGEQDYRPTHVDPTNPAGPAEPERQLGYYVNTCPTASGGWTPCAQLAFTRDAPQWAALLLRLEENTPFIRAPGGAAARLALPGATIDSRPFTAPGQLRPTRGADVLLPLVAKP